MLHRAQAEIGHTEADAARRLRQQAATPQMAMMSGTVKRGSMIETRFHATCSSEKGQ